MEKKRNVSFQLLDAIFCIFHVDVAEENYFFFFTRGKFSTSFPRNYNKLLLNIATEAILESFFFCTTKAKT